MVYNCFISLLGMLHDSDRMLKFLRINTVKINHYEMKLHVPHYPLAEPLSAAVEVITVNPCHPSPCGANAVCREHAGAGSCACLPDYFGDPYTGCRPECVVNTDCAWDRACVRNKCLNPCSGTCGVNTECKVVHHAPVCFCRPGYSGNPLVACHLVTHDPSKISSIFLV